MLKAQTRFIAKRVKYFSWLRHRTVCNRRSRIFTEFRVCLRADARCPMCGSLERHRLAIVFFPERTDLFDGNTCFTEGPAD